MNSFTLILLILNLILQTEQAILSYGSNKNDYQVNCIGNFQLINGNCISCKLNEVSFNRKCVSLTNNIPNIQLEDSYCQIKDLGSENCLLCKSGYYPVENKSNKDFGKCIRNNCLIYSEALRKCLSFSHEDKSEFIPDNNFRLPNQKGQQSMVIVSFNSQQELKMPLIVTKEKLNIFSIEKTQQKNTGIQGGIPVILQQKFIASQNIFRTYSPYEKDLPVDKCFKFATDFQICVQCQPGYILNKIQNVCSKIQKKEYIFLQQNTKQDKLCLKPNLNNKNLPQCLQCDVGYYYSFLSRNCESGDPLCKSLNINGQCTSCFQSYSLKENRCVKIE